jgi:hypothetical protein
MLDRFPESDRGRTIAHARTERSARPKLGGWNGVVRGGSTPGEDGAEGAARSPGSAPPQAAPS